MYGFPKSCAVNGIAFLFDRAADYDYIRPEWPEQPGRQQKQMHFDFQVDDLPSAVKHAEAIRCGQSGQSIRRLLFVTSALPAG